MRPRVRRSPLDVDETEQAPGKAGANSRRPENSRYPGRMLSGRFHEKQLPTELDFSVAKRLQRALEFNQRRLRAIPLTFSSDRAARRNLLARSAGVRRNYSMSSVRSMAYFCAASMRPPGAGLRCLCSARASSSAVNIRRTLATVLDYANSQTCPDPSHACAGRPGIASWRGATSRRCIRG